MRTEPHLFAKIWLHQSQHGFKTKTDLVWMNLVLERQFDFIPDKVWQRVCRYMGSEVPEVAALVKYEDVLDQLKNNLPFLPLSGPQAICCHSESEEEFFMTTLIPSFRFPGIFGVDETFVNAIDCATRSLSTALQQLDEKGIADNTFGIRRLIDDLNDKVHSPFPESSIIADDVEISRDQQNSSHREEKAQDLEKLYSIFDDFINGTSDNSEIAADVRWASPENSLEDFLAEEKLRLPSSEAARRSAQLLGLKPYIDPNDSSAPECRFLVSFKVDGKYRKLVRKPTMLSGGIAWLYATFRDSDIDSADSVQGYGRTVDSKSCKVGIKEAVVPNCLVAAAAMSVRVIGVLPPSEVKDLMNTLSATKFVETIAHNRLEELEIDTDTIEKIFNNLDTRDNCDECSPRCY